MDLNILVVDDSAVMRAILARTLRLSGLRIDSIHEASNGQEALRVLARESIGLVLLDINMPVMGGEELVARIRAEPAMAELPLLVISAERNEKRICRLRERGAKFVHKPFTPEGLREVLLELLEVSDAWARRGRR